MKKYRYNSDFECFERFKDGKPFGKKLWVNILEARKIVTLYNLGNSIGLIQSKMTFSSKKATGHTVKTIIQLYENDEIELDGDYPAPSKDFNDLTVEGRISALEDRIEVLENQMSEINSDCFCNSFAGESKTIDKGIVERIRTWI